jgi:hypothetical protein
MSSTHAPPLTHQQQQRQQQQLGIVSQEKRERTLTSQLTGTMKAIMIPPIVKLQAAKNLENNIPGNGGDYTRGKKKEGGGP